MTTHLKITTATDSHTHFDTHKNNYTLCGLETGGDPALGFKSGKPVKRTVNCPACIQIVIFCKSIKDNELTK